MVVSRRLSEVSSLFSGIVITLCSYTHTGYQQIGARLTSEGLGSNYKDEEVEMTLKMSSNFALVTVMQFAALANDESLATAALERLTSLSEAPAAVAP